MFHGADEDDEDYYGPRDLSQVPPPPDPPRTAIARLLAALRGGHR